ncbi:MULTISPECIES: hypothetical protein [unclassified Flavobacterium]|uniref:hypothetical protein n=1 Tax=unclassified Flavobacterium TaxID=196869 RepID=UPI00260917BA|nr:hypothetical protein [Flavobacterium sp.]
MGLFNFFKKNNQAEPKKEKSTSENPSASISREQMHDALTSAIDDRDFNEIQTLMSAVTKDNAPSIYLALNFEDSWFPEKGYDRIIDSMAHNQFVDLNETKDGKTPLTMIAEACHNATAIYARIVESLLNGGADANKTDHLGWSALAYTINKHGVSPTIIQKLIDAGSNLNLVVESDDFIGLNERSILGMAYYNNKDFFAQLKEKGAVMTDEEIEELQDRGYSLEL